MEKILPLPMNLPIANSTTTKIRKFNLFPFNRQSNRLNCRNGFRVKNSSQNGIISKDGVLGTDELKKSDNGEEIVEGSGFVEVFGIGSRRDAVLDFCVASPSLSPSLRFWNILMKDHAEVQMQQRYPVSGVASRKAEAEISSWLASKAVILVASAAYGYDHVAALDILREAKAGNLLVVGIILKPFTFEGRRRQDEVEDLMSNLKKQASFCIAVDTDALLEKDLVTLDEAFNNSNQAVLMALNAISILTTGKYMKLLNVTDGNNTIGLELPELRKILESYQEGKIGFGSSYNMKSSILQAVYGLSAFGVGAEDSDVIICILASSDVTDCSMDKTAHTFRLTTGFKGQLILSVIHDPQAEPNLKITTVVTFSGGKSSSEKSGIFSTLARHFPFVFYIMKKQHQQIPDNQESSCTESDSQIAGDTTDSSFVASMAGNIESGSDIPQTLLSNGSEEISLDEGNGSEPYVNLFAAGSHASPSILNSEGVPAFNRELLTRQSLGSAYQINENQEKDETDNRKATAINANVKIFRPPVGVKHPEQLKECPSSKDQPERIVADIKKAPSLANVSMARKRAADDGLEEVADSYNHAISLEKRVSTNTSRRQGGLSTRAASMLEAERHSEKKLIRIVEMKYRGGFYRGQIQGGLPEGKGYLTLSDGSIYDGMWRYGKRSGLGTFYYNNGDFFQGSWRDDVMHGKGWFYFHTGDRWFVNFWKGKANGEGRYYSKLGNVFFGHFKDGWRHGNFVHVSVDGTRWQEVWDEGVLVSRTELDSDASGAGTG